jgi:pimeloyl-ACP methyl ester carboxylesterase
VIAVSPFSDLRTAASERAPFFASSGNIAKAFELAEAAGKFRADDVSPMVAAAHIVSPTLIVHGDDDDETPPAHAQRIFAALRARKRLILVPGAGHNHVLDAHVWDEIDAWLDAALAVRPQ